jgi:hypothetical protein
MSSDGHISSVASNRDLRIDWLRGLAMTCVIINHSKLRSVLSWFSYERFWVVTAAEVFVVLSGVVLGMVYGRRIARAGWQTVVHGLLRRAITLYVAFVAVTVSVVVLSILGVDVGALMHGADQSTGWFTDPFSLDAAAWRDLLLMRSGVWAFEIIGLYVCLVLIAIPSLLTLRFFGWRPLIAASWMMYIAYRIWPHPLTSAEFEVVFPIATWQLLFVHGIAIGYHREGVGAFASRWSKPVLVTAAAAVAIFFVFASCNPWSDGPAWLRLSIVSPARFASLYGRYFGLTELGIGRVLNLAVALPLGYAALTAAWPRIRLLHAIFVTLGQHSLGAFVLHTYGLLVTAQVGSVDHVWVNAAVQVLLIAAITVVLAGSRRLAVIRRQAVTFTESPRSLLRACDMRHHLPQTSTISTLND